MATKLEVYNLALGLLGARPLATLSDARAERRALDAVYGSTLSYMIEAALWHFAAVTDELSPSSTVTSNFGYRYVYEKPDDYVRLLKISDNERFFPSLDDYAEENDYFLCDAQLLYISYVSNDIAAGGDPGKWTPSFVTAFADELAYRACESIASSPITVKDWLAKRKKQSLYYAKSKSSVNQMRAQFPTGRLVRARAGTRYINAMRRTPYA